MNYRKIPNSNTLISEIGFGAWGIGGDVNGSIAYGKTDDYISLEALITSFNLGITFYDTSDFYGFGHSELLIGKAFKHNRDKVFIATKGGMVSRVGERNFDVNYIEQAFNKSLKRLQSDYIDLYQLHNPSINSPYLEDLFEKLLFFKSLGKIKYIGVSANSPKEALFFINNYHIDSIQINFNLIDQRPINDGLFDIVTKNKIMLIARTPLCFGFLSGNDISIDQLKEGDHRRDWSYEQLFIWKNAPQKFKHLFSDFSNFELSEIALNYCLSYPEVTTVIPGILTPAEAKKNAIVSNLERFNLKKLSEIEEVYNKNQFFVKN